MGCCGSAEAQGQAPEQKGARPQKSKPMPMAFAVMRNCHEAVRAGLKECQEAADAGDIKMLKERYAELSRCIDTHAKMEDHGFFPFLNKTFDDALNKGGVGELHEHDDELQTKLKKAIEGGNDDDILAAFKTWKEDHLSHLVKEEKVAGPLVPKYAKTLGRDPIKMGAAFNEYVLKPEAVQDLDFFAGYCTGMLSKHGSQKQDGFTAMRVFAVGLQYGTTPEQWRLALPEIKKAVPADMYKKLVDEFDIEADGKQVRAV
mmetsp:Transcript_11986/g.23080  ORF Transcript_11986/g.23080 Transcript_11986/m.23080 type:complete len:259 (-) Transcript_11986:313-1089(-)